MKNLNYVSLKERDKNTLKIADAMNKFSFIINDIIENDSFRIISTDKGKGVLMISLSEGISLFDELENLRLAQIASERLDSMDKSKLINHEDMKKELGL